MCCMYWYHCVIIYFIIVYLWGFCTLLGYEEGELFSAHPFYLYSPILHCISPPISCGFGQIHFLHVCLVSM
jgi:hypothetical protein